MPRTTIIVVESGCDISLTSDNTVIVHFPTPEGANNFYDALLHITTPPNPFVEVAE